MTPPKEIPVYGFTSKAPKITRILYSKIRISQSFDPQKDSNEALREYLGIWDTGATNSVITEKVVNECGLKPIGVAKVSHVGGESHCDVFLINMVLPNNIGISALRVTQGKITGNVDVLIGMDIMTLGDFVLSNFYGKTVFSFRVPSIECLDFNPRKSSESSSNANPPNFPSKIGRNAPCPCGSGKKYKRCHGR